MRLGIGKTALLGTGHGMASNEIFFHIKGDNLFVNRGFYTAYVRKYTVLIQQIFQLGKISSVAGDRCAEKKITAAFEILVDGRTGRIYDILLYGKCKSFPVFVKSDNFIAGVVFSYGFGN